MDARIVLELWLKEIKWRNSWNSLKIDFNPNRDNNVHWHIIAHSGQKQPDNFNEIFEAKAYLENDFKKRWLSEHYTLAKPDIDTDVNFEGLVSTNALTVSENIARL